MTENSKREIRKLNLKNQKNDGCEKRCQRNVDETSPDEFLIYIDLKSCRDHSRDLGKAFNDLSPKFLRYSS